MPAPLVVPAASSTASGITRRRYRQRLAETLGYFATGTISTQASAFEVERTLIASNLQSDWPQPDHFDGLFCYLTGGALAPAQRRLIDGSFDGPLGALSLDTPLASAVTVGSTFELSVLPADRYLGFSGLNEIINQALEQLTLVDFLQVTVTATNGVKDTEYEFTDLSWPVKGVQAVIYPRTSTTSERRREMPKCWDYELDAESPVLSFRELPAQVGDVIEVKVLRPAHTRKKAGGVWTDTTTGLASDEDQAIYDIPTVVQQARPLALRRLAQNRALSEKERMQLLSDALDEDVRASQIRFFSRFKGSGAQKAGVR